MENSRRKFIGNIIKTSAAVSVGSGLSSFTAKSYRSIIGANEKIRIASMGVNGRGLPLGLNFSQRKGCEVAYVCDVDSRAADKFAAAIAKNSAAPRKQPDFRKALEDKNVDVLVIAAPDHWHAPAAILSCQAGKHVYVEKPCSHNPNEGEMLVAASWKYNRLVQMGNQRRSWPNIINAMRELKDGIIGRPYFATAWYSNNRSSIGIGKNADVPAWLNYDLWQGPAPRRPYMDNILHYNWHWFWHWGTGEALNNGTHMIDLARLGLGVDFPTSVSSSGGRFRYKDDWQTPDTQVINLEFDSKKMITWEGRSCNGTRIEGSDAGVIFYGEKGTMAIGSGDSYTVYDLLDKKIKEVHANIPVDIRDTANPSQWLDSFHIDNLLDAIRLGRPLNSEIAEGHKSTLLVQLGNIAFRTKHNLKIDPSNGHILDDRQAQDYWKREYEKGWEPNV